MRNWPYLVVCLAIGLTASAQDKTDLKTQSAQQIDTSDSREAMRQRFLELARQRAEEMSLNELQFKVSELNRELRESEADKSLKLVDDMLSKVIQTYPNTFAARRAASALAALREAPTRLPPRVSTTGQTPASGDGQQVEQIINIDALRRPR